MKMLATDWAAHRKVFVSRVCALAPRCGASVDSCSLLLLATCFPGVPPSSQVGLPSTTTRTGLDLRTAACHTLNWIHRESQPTPRASSDRTTRTESGTPAEAYASLGRTTRNAQAAEGRPPSRWNDRQVEELLPGPEVLRLGRL